MDVIQTKTPCGMNCYFDGTVPSGAGVSSSSAMVCSSMMATFHINGCSPKKVDLTQYAIKSERYCGVESGGMDQSASIMGEIGKALLISFYPKLDAQPIQFPKCNTPFVFVIANTLVVSNKAETAPKNYNLRVVEGRLASALLCKAMGVSEAKSMTFMEVQEKWVEKFAKGKNLSQIEILQAMLDVVENSLKKEGYTLAEVAAELGLTEQTIQEKYIQGIKVIYDKLYLYKRAIHIFSEACRVYQFCEVCKKRPPFSGDLTKDLGKLMDASQDSCSNLYQCSCPELDELCRIAKNAGAYGSRLTGAGWGGCTVSMVPEDKIEEFKATLKQEYYFKKFPEMAVKEGDSEAVKQAKEDKLNQAIFQTKPSSGITIIAKDFHL